MSKWIDKIVYHLTDKPKGYKKVNNPPKNTIQKLLRPNDARQEQYNNWLRFHSHNKKKRNSKASKQNEHQMLEMKMHNEEVMHKERIPDSAKPKSRFSVFSRSYWLVKGLKRDNIKFTEEDIIFITKDRTKQTIWLENGNVLVGFEHIKRRHSKDFANKYGVNETDIPAFLKKVVENGWIVHQGVETRNGIPCVTRVYLYRGQHYILLGIGKNGFIVTAYPNKKKGV